MARLQRDSLTGGFFQRPSSKPSSRRRPRRSLPSPGSVGLQALARFAREVQQSLSLGMRVQEEGRTEGYISFAGSRSSPA